jgi:hypothetical protein
MQRRETIHDLEKNPQLINVDPEMIYCTLSVLNERLYKLNKDKDPNQTADH